MDKTHGSKISVTSAWRLLLTPCNFSGPSGIITEPTRAQVVMALDPPKISVNHYIQSIIENFNLKETKLKTKKGWDFSDQIVTL